MSTQQVHVTIRRGGRVPTPPKTERGARIMALIESQNLTLQEAARKAGITVPSLRSAIHGDPGRLTVKTVAALCRNLGLPLELVAPAIPA